MKGRDEARKYPEELSEKKTGLFLVENHPFNGTVWLDCRNQGMPEVYGYNSDGEVLDVSHTSVTKKVKAAVRSNNHVSLGSFTEVTE